MRQVNFTTFQKGTDNKVRYQTTMEWVEFVEMMTEKHLVVEDKADAFLISPFRFKTEDYIPAKYEDEIIIKDGHDFIGRYAENVIDASMLFLDFDSTMSIAEAKKKFSRYEHVGYTSHSHRTKKKQGKDCFRIVLLLDKPIPKAELYSRKKSIIGWAKGVDRTTIDISRSFYIPSCSSDMECLAMRWHNEGVPLDWTVFEPEPEVVYVPREINVTDDVRSKLLEKLKAYNLGYEPTWSYIAVAMHQSGFSFDEFCYVTIGGLMRQKTASDCKAKWNNAMRSKKQLDIGYLWNVLKGKHNRPVV